MNAGHFAHSGPAVKLPYHVPPSVLAGGRTSGTAPAHPARRPSDADKRPPRHRHWQRRAQRKRVARPGAMGVPLTWGM